MRRHLRWSYLAPRLILLLALLAASELGFARLCKYAFRRAGEAAVGARVDVEGAEASVLGTHATLTGVAVADPRSPMTNLLEADAVGLDFDASSALHKRLVVKQGVVRGLRFGTPRTASGALPEREDNAQSKAFTLSRAASSKAAERWLRGVHDRLSTDVQNELESVRLARQLCVKWPAEYQRVAAEARELRRAIEELRAEVSEARENPLRNVNLLRTAPERLAEMQKRLAALTGRLAEMPDEVAADRRAALAAREHDEELLREKLAIENVDAESLGAYLVGESFAAPVSELVGWLRWARELARAGAAPQAERSRGVDVRFARCTPAPRVLVESLRIEGAVDLARGPVAFSGRLTDLASEPTVHGEPTRLTLATSGASAMEIQAVVDRTGRAPKDEFLAICPRFALPKMKLGEAEKLAIEVAPCSAQLSAYVVVSGERIAGNVRLTQDDVLATPHLNLGLSRFVADADLQRALAEELTELPRLETHLIVSGDLDRPRLEIQSTAGPVVAQALQRAARGVADKQAQRALAAAQGIVKDNLAALDHEMAYWTKEVTPQLRAPQAALEALAGELKTPLGAIGARAVSTGSLLK